LLAAVAEKFKLKLQVAHLDHQIRKHEALLDQRFVQQLARKLNLPVTCESFDVPTFAKQEKLGLEDAARRIRYAFLERVANQIKADKIALGHNADDNVETFLMRLLRGAGLKGLSGIPPVRKNIIRPLITTWRKDIEDYVTSLKLVPRRDYTNYESRYLRNRVRLKLLPQLKLYNLNIKEIILQTILLITADHSYLELQAEGLLESAISSCDEDSLKLKIDRLCRAELPIQGHVLRQAILRVKGDLQDLSFQHIQSILHKLRASEKWEIHLPRGIVAYGNQGELKITKEREASEQAQPFAYKFSLPGEVELPFLGKRLRGSFVDQADAVADYSTVAFFDAAVFGQELVVRSRQAGDRLIPLGMKGSKKLQDLFVDEKIPFEFRDGIPVVESLGKIIWVAGVRIDDRAKIKKQTKQIVKLELI